MEQRKIYHELFDTFRELRRSFHQVISKEAEKSCITAVQFHAMSALRKQPDIGMSELAEQLHLGNSTLSGVIDRMEKAGYVERRRSEVDRRTVTLQLTEEGREVEERTNQLYKQAISRLDAIPEEEFEHLIRTFRQMIHLLETEREGE
ncbi:MarR family winged helix-turn-helix transcriptional regulator [Paenibacillus caui]|uniref:MarR family winged helix-turn-helix transcriptional regulator n=1 Tax=Paenibacillus caui TaxID=2873927 RepID=UPI001CA81CDB|nr:MarR family transcriptional regulator [Paenibacillus caui]